MQELESLLNGYGRALAATPLVIQYNKRDLPNRMPVSELERSLNLRGVPQFEAVASAGLAVFETLRVCAALAHARILRAPST